MGKHVSLADQLRAHRAVFMLAQELRCTPKEAEAELKLREAETNRREAHERWVEAKRRLDAKMAAPMRPRLSDPETAGSDQPWMMRD